MNAQGNLKNVLFNETLPVSLKIHSSLHKFALSEIKERKVYQKPYALFSHNLSTRDTKFRIGCASFSS